jgi:hypothetical protein
MATVVRTDILEVGYTIHVSEVYDVHNATD